ncbi:MAG: alpha/beta fold hydrolase [Bacteroidia bacterium]
MLQLHFKRYGETGTPLLILHGFLGSLDNWHTLATALGEAGFVVFAIDQRNHGKSPHTREHSLQLMADDVKDFCQQQQLNSVILLGHSMGGKVAMRFALDHPEKVARLIVADIAPRAYKPGAHDEVFKAIFNVQLDKIATRKEAEEQMKAWLGDFGTRQFILKSLERTESGFKWKFNIETLYREYNQAILAVENDTPVNVPALFIRGALSLYVREEDKSGIIQLFPQAQFETIENAGHWLHADQPALFLAKILGFVKQQ